MTPDEFWLTFNYELFAEIALLVIASFASGYGCGYKLFVFRRIASSAT